MVDAGTLAAFLVYGVLLGCVLAAIAHGLNLIWGVTKVVNIAHGEFVMLGAYGAYFLNLYWGLNPLIAAPIDALLGLAVGVGFYFGFLHRELRGKEQVSLQTELVTLVATFGLSLVLVNLGVALLAHPVAVQYSTPTLVLGPVNLPLGGTYVAVASVAIIAATHVFLTRTYLGNAIRAYSQDIGAAKLMGVNPTMVAAVATGLGFAMTMAGGALLTVWLHVGIDPYLGQIYAPISFVIVALGGAGKMWGSLVGGLTLGILLDVLPAFVPSDIAYAIAFLVIIPVLVFTPEGILR